MNNHTELPLDALLARHDQLQDALEIPRKPERLKQIKDEMALVAFELCMRQVKMNKEI